MADVFVVDGSVDHSLFNAETSAWFLFLEILEEHQLLFVETPLSFHHLVFAHYSAFLDQDDDSLLVFGAIRLPGSHTSSHIDYLYNFFL